MFYYGYGLDSGYLLVIIAAILSLVASAKVNSTFKKYSQKHTARNITAERAARSILDSNGLHDVKIEPISGNLTDHYDPRANVIRLSESVINSTSVAAVGVAAHEAGHAVQYATNYGPIRLRASIVSLTQFSSRWAIYILMFGILLSFGFLAKIGFWLYAVVAFFQLVTLPVEFNASRRALTALEDGGALDREELSGARKVLSAAAMTYVAALLSALVQLLRLWSIVQSNERRRR